MACRTCGGVSVLRPHKRTSVSRRPVGRRLLVGENEVHNIGEVWVEEGGGASLRLAGCETRFVVNSAREDVFGREGARWMVERRARQLGGI